jgi:hypothetical protein
MGEATYTRRWNREFTDHNEAMKHVIESVGVPLLFGLVGLNTEI